MRCWQSGWLGHWVRGFSLAIAIAFTPGSVGAGEDFFGSGFEVFTGISPFEADPLADAELGELRGRFLGFFFSVEFAGMVEMGGAATATLEVIAGIGGQSESIQLVSGSVSPGIAPGAGGALVTDATGQQLNVRAVINEDAFSNSNFIAQISQVPGNQNNIRQVLVLNLAVINAGATPFAEIRDQLGPLFGF